jgi:hypothetical protein
MANAIAVASLEDGRLQIWSVNADGSIVSRFKTTKDPGSAWSNWASFSSPPGGAVTIAVGTLPGGQLQLFSTNAEGTFTAVQQTTDPNSGWGPWGAF